MIGQKEGPSALGQVGPGVNRFDLVLDDVHERRFDDLGRVISFLDRPVAEGRAEAARDDGDLQLLEQFRQGHCGKQLSIGARKHVRTVAFAERPHCPRI